MDKLCSKCKQTKPLDDFYKRPNGKPQCWCKACWIRSTAILHRLPRYKLADKIRLAEWRKKNPDKVRSQTARQKETRRRYHETHMERARELRRIQKKSEQGRKWGREQSARARALNPEKFKARKKKYRSTEKGKHEYYIRNLRKRIARVDSGHTRKQWLELLSANEYRCFYCHIELTIKTATKDHKIPLVKGGKDDIENIAPACLSCNSSKRQLTVAEFQLRKTTAN